MSEAEPLTPKKKQKTYSLPQPLVEWLHDFYEKDKEAWARAGITNETQLLTALVTNGQPQMEEILEFLKRQKLSRRPDQQPPT